MKTNITNPHVARLATEFLRPTPLNRIPLLWKLFDNAKIAVPAAEAYEYAVIEAEEAEDKIIEAEFTKHMNAGLARHETRLLRAEAKRNAAIDAAIKQEILWLVANGRMAVSAVPDDFPTEAV